MLDKLKKKSKEHTFLTLEFSDMKAMYEFTALHISNMEKEVLKTNEDLSKNEEYNRFLFAHEKTYQIMQDRINKYFADS